MNKKEKAKFIYDNLMNMFPNASCELDYSSEFELLIAVVLSAQTTDKSVNKVTRELFKKYPDAFSLANAKVNEVEDIIKPIGLYRNKTKNIIALSKALVEKNAGLVPDNQSELMALPGVGRKTANVIVSELFNVEAIAVDTHVERISKRLKIANGEDSVLEVEKKLMMMFPKENWHKLHHLLIFFGRYLCSSKKPQCDNCPFSNICKDCNKSISL